ncbi:MAG TPA: hypothetical protein VM408_02965 [Methylomirabilota bacterium]|nr:hypothetical protein [Methylomirabilota bacterium]
MSHARRSLPVAALVLAIVSACGTISTAAPEPTPADFEGIAAQLAKRGIEVAAVVSGDAGCQDPTLVPTSIGFTAHGLDQTEPTRLYVYIFRNRDAFERLRGLVDECARSFVTDPDTYETIEESPFVVAAQGPWAPKFEDAFRQALNSAAGTGN